MGVYISISLYERRHHQQLMRIVHLFSSANAKAQGVGIDEDTVDFLSQLAQGTPHDYVSTKKIRRRGCQRRRR